MELGEREIIYLSLHCHHQNDSCIKMGSDESHFNVFINREVQSHTTVSTNHNLFKEKGEPKWNQFMGHSYQTITCNSCRESQCKYEHK